MRLRTLLSTAVVTALVAVSASVGAVVAPAAAATGDPAYQVTFVARVCPTYPSIMANRARNNIQESLRDLGKDTVYTAGQPVSPTIEGPNNPACTPLDDWQFQMGTGYTGKTPASDYLSTVTGAYPQTIRVQPTTPELDPQGQPTGRILRDAVTVTLTAEQAQRAQQGNRLWAQGGTKADPLLQGVFGDDYGFGALRCAIDNLNGDNVEWIGFPSGSTHVYCYYYAVTPPPSAGTIVVRKSLETGSNGPATFRYVGNISYTTSNDFFLTPPDDTTTVSQSFVRAAGDAWDFEEQPLDGFDFVSLTCAQTTPPITGPASSVTITGAKAVVRVGDGATVTCDYVNRDTPKTTGDLTISKVTIGGIGSFPVRITDPLSAVTNLTATTTDEFVPEVVGSTTAGATGDWSLRETLPAPTALGAWATESIQCNGADVPFTTAPAGGGATFVTATRAISAGETVDCFIANRFDPGGELTIAKRSVDGTGTFAFPVLRGDQFSEDEHPSDAFTVYEATTTSPGVTTAAAPEPGRPALTGLPVDAGAASTYYLSELSPPETDTDTWLTTAVGCRDLDSGATVPITIYQDIQVVAVELTAAHPRVGCTATNTLTAVGTLTVSKVITGAKAGLQGQVTLTITCADGSDGTLVVAAGVTGTTTSQAPLVLREDTTCTVTETQTGATDAAPLTNTTHVVDGGAPTSGTTVTVAVSSGDAATVAFTDVYGGLAPSGASRGTPAYALLGLLLVGLGAAAYRLARE
jgi:hypothetical protein